MLKDELYKGDICDCCGSNQMPPWSSSRTAETARACQNCGHIEERKEELAWSK